MKRSPSALHNTKKGQNSTQKIKGLLAHIVELSIAVVKVDIKVINIKLLTKLDY